MKKLVLYKFIFLSMALILVGCSNTSEIESKMTEEIEKNKNEIESTKKGLTSVDEKISEINEETEWAKAEIAMADERRIIQEEYEEYETDENLSNYEEDYDKPTTIESDSEVLTYEEFIAQPHIIEQYLLQGERAPYLVNYDERQAYEVYRRTHEKYKRIFSDKE